MCVPGSLFFGLLVPEDLEPWDLFNPSGVAAFSGLKPWILWFTYWSELLSFSHEANPAQYKSSLLN